jgi:hypothetical protein
MLNWQYIYLPLGFGGLRKHYINFDYVESVNAVNINERQACLKEVAVAYYNVKLQYLPAPAKNCRSSVSDSKGGFAWYEASTTGCRFVHPCSASYLRHGAVRFHSFFLAVEAFALP